MRRIARVFIGIALLLVVVVGVGLAILFLRFPAVGSAPQLQVAGAPAQVERGSYLANHVTVCVDCHSPRDWSRFSGPPLMKDLGRGGTGLTRAEGFPGELPAPNLTPTALAGWSDGEIIRAVTSGVDRNGAPLFPFMPYKMYAALSQEDAEALVAYLRTLPPQPIVPVTRELDFPLNLISRTMPRQATLRPTTPHPGDPGYGEYLVSIAGCRFCHTPQDKGSPVPGMDFAGGQEFPLPSGRVVSPNITPDPLSGIGGWDRDAFLSRFRAFAAELPEIAPDAPNTVMPWTLYAGMTDEDLAAIYDYLRTVEPVEHRVEKWPDADLGS